MKPSALAVMSVAALAVVGYAAYTLMDDPGSTRSRAKTAAAGAAESDDERAPAPRKGGVRAKPGSFQTAARAGTNKPRPKAGPARMPTPSVPLDQAREDFTTYMAEVERLIEVGDGMQSAVWVEHYAKGNELLIPLQQHLSWDDPTEAEELQALQERFRIKIGELEKLVIR